MKRLPALAVAGAVALGIAATPALAAPKANKASAAQLAAMAKAVQSSPVAGMNQVPTSNYAVRNGMVYAGSSYWGKVSIASKSDTFQGATAVLVRPAGGSAWTVVDVGTSDTGCWVAPVGVAAAFKLGGATCGIGDGYMAAPQSLKKPTLTGYQLTMRFFNYLNPQNQSKLEAFLADGFLIQRANNTAANKAAYLANHPTYNDAVLRVDNANYGDGLLTVGGVNWQTTVPNTYVPVLYTYAWVDGAWQLLSFARFAPSATLPPPATS
ncbi:MAG: hypothetical protein ACKOGE_06980 [Actinomycetota bacterium]